MALLVDHKATLARVELPCIQQLVTVIPNMYSDMR